MMYINKYRPHKLSELSFNHKLTDTLKTLTSTSLNRKSFPNIYIYGQPGSGKKVRIKCLLSSLFNEYIYKTVKTKYSVSVNKKIEYIVTHSNHHFEITPGDYMLDDHYVLNDFINKIAKTKNIFTDNYKILIIHDAHKLSNVTQSQLRRQMEINSETLRFILIGTELSKISEPLQSRCLILRNASPSLSNIKTIIDNIISNESKTIKKYPTDSQLEHIIHKTTTARNLTEIIHNLQMSYIKKKYKEYTFPPVKLLDELVKHIKSNEKKGSNNNKDSNKTSTSIKNIQTIRKLIYKLHSVNIDSSIVIKYVSKFFHQSVFIASHFEHQMRHGNMDVIHVEAFIVNLINLI